MGTALILSALAVVACVAPRLAVAEISTEEMRAREEHEEVVLAELHRSVLEKCGKSTASVEYPVTYPTSDPAEKTIERRSYSVTKWTGACLGERRDGVGELTTIEDESDNSTEEGRITHDISTIRKSGRFMGGVPQGLWCIESYHEIYVHYSGRKSEVDGERGCRLLSGKEESDPYFKLPDGRWQLLESGQDNFENPQVLLAAGTLEQESERIIAEVVASGKAPAISNFTMESSVMDGLVAGSKFTLNEAPGRVAFKGKRVALILSSPSIDSLKKFIEQREAFIVAAADVTGVTPKFREVFSEVFSKLSDPRRLLLGIATALRLKAGSVEAVDDLVGLAVKQFDYAVVVDWRPTVRFDLLGKYGDQRTIRKGDWDDSEMVADQKLGALVVNQSLEVVMMLDEYAHSEHAEGELHKCYRRENWGCDEVYMLQLATFFEANWQLNPPGKIVESWMSYLE